MPFRFLLPILKSQDGGTRGGDVTSHWDDLIFRLPEASFPITIQELEISRPRELECARRVFDNDGKVHSAGES